jgi:allantoinase
MPLNAIPPTTTLDNFKVKGAEAERVGIHVDVGYWGGIIPGNAHELVPLLRAGVKGFKCFLIDSGVEVRKPANLIDGQEFPQVGEADLTQACEALLVSEALHSFFDNFLGYKRFDSLSR